MRRRPEPELMCDAEQARAYAQADYSNANALFVDLLLRHFPKLRNGRMIDLGCGPADIPIRICRALPRARVVALDASAAMLDQARIALRSSRLGQRIELVRADLFSLPQLHGTFDAVLANSLHHHAPDPVALWREMALLAKPGGALLQMDLLRPASAAAAQGIVDRSSAHDPQVLRRDFYNSLCAAYTLQEVRAQLRAAGLDSMVAEQVNGLHWAAWGMR